jgi:hypothetical protein
MKTESRRRGIRSVVLGAIVVALVLTACSGSDDSGSAMEVTTTYAASADEEVAFTDAAGAPEAGDRDMLIKAEIAVPAAIGTDVPDGLKVIRDGRVEIRVEPGTFGQVAGQLRSIAQDLGGYITAGETSLVEVDDVQYTVGWLTMRVPVDRFDDALDRVDGLGERLSLNVSSQDVTEEYVDLQGRLRYWKTQEEFYTRLMEEATDIDDLVTIQTRMQDVLLNIEQIEGRLRYLDSRTDFSTLTVGLTEIPGETPPEPEPDEPSMLSDAVDQAGEVLLATVGGIIVAGAFALPILLIALIVFGLWRAVVGTRRRSRKDEDVTDG